MNSDYQIECVKCKAWDMAAKQNGYQSGMCEECFEKGYFAVHLEHEPKLKKEEAGE